MQSVTSNAVANALNEKLNKDYWTLFTGQAPSSQQIMNTHESRKFSDYNFIIFVVGSDGQNTRTTIILPREVFTSGERVYLYAHGSGMVAEVDVSYKSDTEFYMQQDLSTGNPFTPYVRIYGI